MLKIHNKITTTGFPLPHSLLPLLQLTKGHAFDAAVPTLVAFRVADELGMKMAKGPTSLRMHLVVDAVTSFRFEVTDPGSEEVVLIKILQVFLACVKSEASLMPNNQQSLHERGNSKGSL